MIKIQQTYVIGIGRQGRWTVAHLKRRMAETYGELPAIRLLAIDLPAGESAELADVGLGPTEEVALPLGPELADFEAARRLYAWLPDGLAGLEGGWARTGTQTRAGARLAWHANLKALLPFLMAQLNEMGAVTARDAMAAKGFEVSTDRTEGNVFVVGSLGEAGSGLLVDAAYVFHHLYRSLGLLTAGTGLLFLPPAAQADAGMEARAYAALKEINAWMSGTRTYRCDYRSGGAVYLPVEIETPVFNRGCYLIDTRNEKTLTLKDDQEAAVLAGEWLFRTLLTPLKARIDEFASTQGAIPWVQGQLAAYNSLGLAGYVLPAGALIESCARQLGEAVIGEQLLKPELFSRVADRVSAFTGLTRFKPDDLVGDALRLDRDGRPIKLQSELIARLKSLPREQIVASVQATMGSIGREVLPGLKTQIDSNARRVMHDAEEGIDQEVAAILRGGPPGALSLATQLVSRLRDDAARYGQSLKRRETALLARNQQLVNVLARHGALLKNAVASVPPWPLVAAAGLAGVLAPLVMATVWLWQGLEVAPGTALGALALRVLLIAGVWLAGLAGAAFTFWQTSHGVERIRDQFAGYLQNRFETELSLALAQSAQRVYEGLGGLADARLERLAGFADRLARTEGAFKREVAETPLVGNLDFTLQRSALTAESVRALYARYASLQGRQADTEAHGYALIEKYGALDGWIDLREEDIRARLLDYGRALFAPIDELRVDTPGAPGAGLDAGGAAGAGAPSAGAPSAGAPSAGAPSAGAPSAGAPGAGAAPDIPGQLEPERVARDVCDKAAPLCTFNVYHGGQAPVSTVQLFVGLESPSQGVMKQAIEQVDPAAAFEPTGDRHSLIATAVRRGMPLFGLLRLGDFRRSYFAALGRAATVLHVDDDGAMAPDLNALTTLSLGPTQPDPGTVFALGAAFGLIAADGADGRLVARDEQGEEVTRLAPGRLESAVLLGADDKLLGQVDAAVQRRAGALPAAEAIAVLAAHVQRAPSLDGWERRRIDDYMRLLRG